jgi:alkylated DNA repair dioxygenase AlkB
MNAYIDALIADWDPDLSSGPAPRAATGEPPGPAPKTWRVLTENQGRVRVCEDYLSADEQAALFAHCAGLAQWEYDKPLGTGRCQRRGVCMQADPATPAIKGYRYAGQVVHAEPLDGPLGALLVRVNVSQGTDFNSWFLNMYRPRGTEGSAGDYLGKHSDDERSLGVAADGRSVVFGLTLTSTPACRRTLRFERKDGRESFDLETRGGQAYVMEGELQKHWQHSVPRRLGVPGTRISLTARKFV